MTLRLLVYRSLRQHALSSAVTLVSMALAAALLLTVWVVKERSLEAFTRTSSAYDAVLGARGSKLQLVLNGIFHLEASPGNLAWADYEQIKKHPAVALAVPLAVGDNYRGWRIVGTVGELFQAGHPLAQGALFREDAREAVVGSFAAERLGLTVGSTFQPYHGLSFREGTQHEEVFTVTGVLAPTNTPADRVIWIPLKGVQTMSGHDPKAATDVSAVLVKLRSPAAGMMLDIMYNRQGNRLTFAYPANTLIADFFGKISWFDRVLELVALLVAGVAAASVVASIYASMSARQRDLAILRALGARRRLVFAAVVAEAAVIGAGGSLVGLALHGALLSGVAEIVRDQTGVVLPWAAWSLVYLWGPLGLTALAGVGGIIPALKAYRVPVAETLAPTS